MYANTIWRELRSPLLFSPGGPWGPRVALVRGEGTLGLPSRRGALGTDREGWDLRSLARYSQARPRLGRLLRTCLPMEALVSTLPNPRVGFAPAPRPFARDALSLHRQYRAETFAHASHFARTFPFCARWPPLPTLPAQLVCSGARCYLVSVNMQPSPLPSLPCPNAHSSCT